MINKQIKLVLATLAMASIFTLSTSPKEAKAYNTGGDGNFKINSWDVNNFNSSKDLWVQSRNAYNPEKVQNRVVSGDFDGNGKDEIAAFYDYGSARTQIHRYYDQNGSFVAPTAWDSGVGNFNAGSIDNKVVSGDFNGDGKDEILTLYDYGDNTATFFQFSLNSNGTFSDKTVFKTTNFVANKARAVVAGDFNGDGKDEVLVFLDYGNRYTGLFELKMNSNGMLTEKYVWESTTYDSNRIVGKTVAGDFNGDKKDEVAMFYDYGDGSTKIWTLSNNNNNVYSGSESWYSASFDSSNINGKVTSTRNKDGSKDKIIAFYDYTYLNNVTGVFTWQMQSNNQFAGTKEKELSNYEASRINGRVTAGKFDGAINRVTAMYDGVVVQSVTNRDKVINEAYKHLGKPYVWGATGPNSFDCSGFTQYVYKQAVGIDITRTTYTQINVGTPISYSELQPGDLVFTYNNEHVGIYVGNGQYINAPQPGEYVKVSPITSFYAARRILN